MILVTITALIAVSSAAKLDRTYLPPPSAASAGGQNLQAPLIKSSSSNQVQTSAPLGSYTNDFQGVVVDAAAPGTRASNGDELTGLGAPRPSYGSTDSKVGDAAFRGSLGSFPNGQNAADVNRPNGPFDSINAQNNQLIGNINGNADSLRPERPQAFKDRNSNILTYTNDVGSDNYSYGFETDNGIAVGENGIAADGIQAQGGYSYKGDDGQVYKVTYIADEKGYRPQGSHLPTPPPIPEEILKSLEKNAQEEAAGIVDDGSYDANKYNTDGDTHHNGVQHNRPQLSQSQSESDVAASSSFINQNSQAFGKPATFGNNLNSLSGHGNRYKFSGKGQSGFTGSQYNIGNSASNSDQFGQNGGLLQNGFGNQGSKFGGQGHLGQSGQLGQLGQSGQTGQLGQFSQSQLGFQSNSQSQPIKPQFTNSNSGFNGNQQLNGQSHQNNQFEYNKPNHGGAQSTLQGTNNYRDQVHLNQNKVESNQAISSAQSQGFHSSNSQSQLGFNKVQNNALEHNIAPNYHGGAQGNLQGNAPNQAVSQAQSQGAHSSASASTHSKPNPNSQGGLLQPLPGYYSNQVIIQNKPSQASSSAQSQGVHSTASASAFVGPELGNPVFQTPTPGPSQFTQTQNQINPNYQILSRPVQAFPSSINPTTVSQTQLTTPVEPQTLPSSQFNSQTPAGFGSFNQQTQFGQFNSQGSFGQQTSSSLPATAPNQFSQSSFINKQEKPQFQQNFNQNQQNQKPDDSYYYNQPSKPFNTPQGSRFPTSPSYQSNNGQNQFLNQNSGTFSSQAPGSQSSFTQFGQPSNINGVTQAAISPFPTVSPTPTSSFGTTSNQFASKPSKNQQTAFSQTQTTMSPQTIPSRPELNLKPRPSQPSQTQNTFSENTQTTVSGTTQIDQQEPVKTQQYEGTVYEYNKPAETIPSKSDSESSQTIQSNIASSKPQNQQGNLLSQKETKPQFVSQTNQFSQTTQSQQPSVNQFNQNSLNRPQQPAQGSIPQFNLQSNSNTGTYFGQNSQSQTLPNQSQFTQQTKPFASTQTQFNQQTQGAIAQSQALPTNQPNAPFKPFGFNQASSLGYPSAQDSKPQGPQFNHPQHFGTTSSGQTQFIGNGQTHELPTPINNGLNLQPQNSKPTQLNQQQQFSASDNQPSQTPGAQAFGQTQNQNQYQNFEVKPFSQFNQAQSSGSIQSQTFKPFGSQPNQPQNQFNQGLSSQIQGFSQTDSATSPQNIKEIKTERPSQFGNQFAGFQGPQGQNAARKGEDFSGPRQPPSFDETGYHY